jgi:hypothetical protein
VSDEYSAVVVRLPELIDLANCDNVKGAMFFGQQAIVSKDSVPGTLGVLFPAESQLSEEYLHMNNLFRDPTKNYDVMEKGYFENNRRVRAQTFRGHRSEAFWMPIESLEFTDSASLHAKREGDTFTELNGHKICEKYIPRGTKIRMGMMQVPKERRVDTKFFPEHFDTTNFFRNQFKIPKGAYIIGTQKLHGTSVRVGNVPVKQKLGWLAKLAKRFGVPVNDTAYELVAGSRRVVKDSKNPDGGFYDTDIYTDVAKDIADAIPQGFVVYGELVGWTPSGQPIQKGYTYGLPRGVSRFYVYRVAQINPQGKQFDLSWEQVKEFATQRGLYYTPQLFTDEFMPNEKSWTYPTEQFLTEYFLDKRLADDHRLEGFVDEEPVPLEPDNVSDEGVVIRVEGMVPQFYKAKSPKFLAHETKMLDQEVEDLESVG